MKTQISIDLGSSKLDNSPTFVIKDEENNLGEVFFNEEKISWLPFFKAGNLNERVEIDWKTFSHILLAYKEGFLNGY